MSESGDKLMMKSSSGRASHVLMSAYISDNGSVIMQSTVFPIRIFFAAFVRQLFEQSLALVPS